MINRIEFLEQLVHDIKNAERSSQVDVLYCRASGAAFAFYHFNDITPDQYQFITLQIQNAFDQWFKA